MPTSTMFPEATPDMFDFDFSLPLPPDSSSTTLAVEPPSREYWEAFFAGIDDNCAVANIGVGQSSRPASQATLNSAELTVLDFVQQEASVPVTGHALTNEAAPPAFEDFSGNLASTAFPPLDRYHAGLTFEELLNMGASQEPAVDLSPLNNATFELPSGPCDYGLQDQTGSFEGLPREYRLDDFVHASSQRLIVPQSALINPWEADTPSEDTGSLPSPTPYDVLGLSTLASDAPVDTLVPYNTGGLRDAPQVPAPFPNTVFEPAFPSADFNFNDDLFQDDASDWAYLSPLGLPSSTTAVNYSGLLDPTGPATLPGLPNGAHATPSTMSSAYPVLGPLEGSALFDWDKLNKHQEHQREQVATFHLHVPILPVCPPIAPASESAWSQPSGSKRRNEETVEAGLVPTRSLKKKKAEEDKENVNSNVSPADAVNPETSAGSRQPLIDLHQTTQHATTSTDSTDCVPPEDTTLRFGILCPHPNERGVRCDKMLLGGLKSLGQHIVEDHRGLAKPGADGKTSCPLIKTADSNIICGERFVVAAQGFYRHVQTVGDKGHGHVIEGQHLDENDKPVGAVTRHPVYGCPFCTATFSQYFGGRKDSVRRHLTESKTSQKCVVVSDEEWKEDWCNKLRVAQYQPRSTRFESQSAGVLCSSG